MNHEHQQRPHTPAPTSGGGDDPSANEKLEAARAEGNSIYAIAKAHLDQVKSEDSATYLEQSRQRSGE